MSEIELCESSPGDEMRTPCETDVSTLRYTLGSKC